jgi:hypothetical protein
LHVTQWLISVLPEVSLWILPAVTLIYHTSLHTTSFKLICILFYNPCIFHRPKQFLHSSCPTYNMACTCSIWHCCVSRLSSCIHSS